MSVRLERPAAGVATLTLDNPATLNSLTDEMLATSFEAALTEIGADRDVRAAVITGAGRGFCSGADLDSAGFAIDDVAEAARFARFAHRLPVAIRRLGIPVVGAVNGPAAGAGFGLALACDLRLAAPTAFFQSPFVSFGLVPDFGLSYFLPRVVGTATALDLVLTGRRVCAEEALALGIVSRIEDDVVAAATALAEQIAAQPPFAVQTARENLYRSLELSLEDEILGQESATQALALGSAEFRERFAAYRAEITGA
jgi:enoyl-CoA hydratase/carnithine racemase